jgi:hypothetical protein
MSEVIDLVFIMDDDQYKRFEKFADQVMQVVVLDEMAKYELGALSGYYVILVSALSSMRDKNELIRFLSAGLRYVCMRVEGSPYIWFPNEGDAVDLWLDFYERQGSQYFLKDMLTIKERYKLILESNSYWTEVSVLSLVYMDPLDEETVLLDLTDHTPELFTDDDDLVITNEFTGEVHSVDLTIGIPEDYFTIMVLKKLENNTQNIL